MGELIFTQPRQLIQLELARRLHKLYYMLMRVKCILMIALEFNLTLVLLLWESVKPPMLIAICGYLVTQVISALAVKDMPLSLPTTRKK